MSAKALGGPSPGAACPAFGNPGLIAFRSGEYGGRYADVAPTPQEN